MLRGAERLRGGSVQWWRLSLEEDAEVHDAVTAFRARHPLPVSSILDAAIIDAGDMTPDASVIDFSIPDAAVVDMAVALPDAAVDAMDLEVCPAGSRLVGEYAEWCGKVNVHRSAGDLWAVDADCRSGCGQARLPYCQKFWPETAEVVEVDVSAENKPFATAACREEHLRRGSVQFACCAPVD